MSRRKKQGGNGDATLQTLEQKVASDPHTNSFPRLPKWAYALIGTAAAIIYVSGAAAGYLPNPLASQQQPKPVPTAPANRNTSPTIAIDKLATIRQYNPDLADIVIQQVWVNDPARSERFLSDITDYVARGTYLFDTITIGNENIGIAILGNNRQKIELGMEIAKSVLPLYREKLDSSKIQSLLVVKFEDTSGSSGTNSTVRISGDSRGLQTVLREIFLAQHSIYSSRTERELAELPVWYDEAAAENAMLFAMKKFNATKPSWFLEQDLRVLTSAKDRQIITGDENPIGWLRNYYKEHPNEFKPLSKLEIAPATDPNFFNSIGRAMGVGQLLLDDFYSLVSDDAYWATLRDIYAFRHANATKPGQELKTFDNATLEGLMAQRVPQEKTPQFKEIFGKYVYGTVPLN